MLKMNERLGDFEIVRLLGKGGMGEVYEARQNNPERPVALKVLAPWLARDDDALQRFWREAKVPANLDHPGIVRIISTGKTEEGIAYYAMHLVRGISLADMIRRSRTTPLHDPVTRPHTVSDTPSAASPDREERAPLIPIEAVTEEVPMLPEYKTNRYATVVRVGIQAARALAFAHKQGFLHRDIKPSNLMVDHHDQVYLVDFGLTRALHPEEEGTQTGVITGTPWYMSPEQAEGQPLDSRSDIYSLGVTLFEMATQGEGPYTASRQDKNAVLSQVRSGQFVPLKKLAKDVPPALERIIARATSRSPGKRYADAAEMARDLEKCLSGAPIDLSTQALSPKLSPRRRLWPLALVPAICLGGVLVALATLYLRDPGQRQVPDGRNALPESLRQAAPHVPVSLLKNNMEPVWSERLVGTGTYRPWRNQLELYSPPTERVTMLALADPGRTNYEFVIELNYLKSFNDQYVNDMGIFFGWRRDALDGHHRCFMLKLDETPVADAANGRLTIGTSEQIEQRGFRAEGGNWFTPLPEGVAYLPLPRSKIVHTVKLNVREDRFTVIVDHLAAREISLAYIREVRRDTNFSNEGSVGIWTSRGRALFRRPTVTALSRE